jgi:hypothetical protein
VKVIVEIQEKAGNFIGDNLFKKFYLSYKNINSWADISIGSGCPAGAGNNVSESNQGST